MLRALLHRKLGRASIGPEDEAEAEEHPGEEITSFEDPLTSAVFERIAYLEPPIGWDLLRRACCGLHGPTLPEVVPEGVPLWMFWPKLSAGAAGRNLRYVEPDVLLSWDDVVLLIEAKHRGSHAPEQWIEEIRAVRSDPSLKGKRLFMVAAGGLNQGSISGCADVVRRELGDETPALLAFSWNALWEAVSEQQHRVREPGSSAILADIEAALDAWGYRRRFGFDSLSRFAAAFPIQTTVAEMRRWRVR